MQIRAVPWSNWAEWEWVYNEIYGSQPMNAIQRIKAWKSKGKCPHAIDATATLMGIKIKIKLLFFMADHSIFIGFIRNIAR